MNVPPEEADPAAVFAMASSLRKACEAREKVDATLNFGEAYNGWDQFMRELMRVAAIFEEWACLYVVFEDLEHTWSYLLEDGFGEACLAVIEGSALASFGADECLQIAQQLGLKVNWTE